jgi:hypothetical protein
MIVQGQGGAALSRQTVRSPRRKTRKPLPSVSVGSGWRRAAGGGPDKAGDPSALFRTNARFRSVNPCRRTGPIDGQQCSLRSGLKVTDAVEKVGGILLMRNNRIIRVDFLNGTWAFDAHLESMLLREPPKIFFRQHRPTADISQFSIELGVVRVLDRVGTRWSV